jgi:hypothetical protein
VCILDACFVYLVLHIHNFLLVSSSCILLAYLLNLNHSHWICASYQPITNCNAVLHTRCILGAYIVHIYCMFCAYCLHFCCIQVFVAYLLHIGVYHVHSTLHIRNIFCAYLLCFFLLIAQCIFVANLLHKWHNMCIAGACQVHVRCQCILCT